MHRYAERISALGDKVFDGITRGIEKENLRASLDGQLSFKPHPAALGKTLTHPHITTDFAESLPEIITSPLQGRAALFESLMSINAYLSHHLSKEFLWPLSMPLRVPHADDIQIADYGNSHIGQLKHLYRIGLTNRYGKMMQIIAGIHYNFSLPEPLLASLDAEKSLSEWYFIGLRNFYRYYWILPYLFGASPACDKTLLQGRETDNALACMDDSTLYCPYATSLRMSDIGYQNKSQSQICISTSDAKSYSQSLLDAIKTPYQPFKEIDQGDGVLRQINDHLLQIENEYYSPIRPKQIAESGEHPSQALCRRGVRYLEVRVLDLNPLMPLGIDETQSAFMDLFLTYCILGNESLLSRDDFKRCQANFKKVVCRGRDPELKLNMSETTQPFNVLANELLAQMMPLAELMDSHSTEGGYAKSLQQQQQKVNQPELTPSAQVLNMMEMNHLSHQALGEHLGREHHGILEEVILPAGFSSEMDAMTEQSVRDEREKVSGSIGDFETYLERFNQSLV